MKSFWRGNSEARSCTQYISKGKLSDLWHHMHEVFCHFKLLATEKLCKQTSWLVDVNQPITTRAMVNASLVCRISRSSKQFSHIECVLRYHTAVLTVPAAGHAGQDCVYRHVVKAMQIFEKGIFWGLFLSSFKIRRKFWAKTAKQLKGIHIVKDMRWVA